MNKSHATRRTLVAMLGLTPVAAGFDAQAFSPPEKLDGPETGVGIYQKEKFAQAFERLAAAVRDGTVDPSKLKVVSELEANKLANQYELTFSFLWQPDAST